MSAVVCEAVGFINSWAFMAVGAVFGFLGAMVVSLTKESK